MQFTVRAFALLTLAAYYGPAAAQSPPAPAGPAPAATRTVVAATKLSSVVEKPLLFRAVSVTIPPGNKQNIVGADSVIYQVSGSSEVTSGAESKVLNSGEGIYIPGGVSASVQGRSGEPSTAIHFLLAPVSEADRHLTTAPASERELYRTAGAISNLKPGGYDLNLTRVTFPPGMPLNPPHHRSGAALYYIVSGTGANSVEGKTEAKGPGSWIYEPSGLVHQWGNPGDVPMTFLTFNINQEGVPAVVQESRPRNQ